MYKNLNKNFKKLKIKKRILQKGATNELRFYFGYFIPPVSVNVDRDATQKLVDSVYKSALKKYNNLFSVNFDKIHFKLVPDCSCLRNETIRSLKLKNKYFTMIYDVMFEDLLPLKNEKITAGKNNNNNKKKKCKNK